MRGAAALDEWVRAQYSVMRARGDLMNAQTQEEPASVSPRRRIWKPNLAQAGFIMSVTLAIINAYYAFRGSVMIVQPSKQVILYRDGEGERAVLTLAVRSEMMNAADGAHGDVLMAATIQLGRSTPQFAYSGEIKPVFTSGASSQEGCALDTRCVSLPGLRTIEQEERILSIPGGQVLGATLVYPIAEWNCTGSAPDCSRYRDFSTAVAALGNKPLEVTVRLKFHGDGTRTLRCQGNPVDAGYLKGNGWMTMSCKTASVSGDPLI